MQKVNKQAAKLDHRITHIVISAPETAAMSYLYLLATTSSSSSFTFLFLGLFPMPICHAMRTKLQHGRTQKLLLTRSKKKDEQLMWLFLPKGSRRLVIAGCKFLLVTGRCTTDRVSFFFYTTAFFSFLCH
jgi:hypothetical protein